MTRLHRVLVACVVSSLAVGVTCSAVAAGSPVEELTKVLPDDVWFFMATSGCDSLKGDFEKSVLGRLWNDPSTQTFCTSVKTELLAKARQEAPADAEVPKKIEMALEYAQLVSSRPLVVGIAPVEVKEGPPGCLFAILDAGDRKADLTAALNELEAMLGEDEIVDVEVGSLKMRGPKDRREAPVYWGWVGNRLVIAGNDAQGAVLKRLVSPRAAAAENLRKVPGHGDAFVVHYDFRKLLGMAGAFAARQGADKEWGIVKVALAELGLANLGTMTARVGFSGPDLVCDAFIEAPEPRKGLFAASRPIEVSLLGLVDSRAVTASALNYDLGGLYDTVMNALQAASGQDVYPVVQQGLAAIQSEITFNIRQDLLGTLAGPVVSYSLPAGKMVEAPMGGFVIVAKLSDPALFEKTMTTLGEYVAGKAKGMLQVGAQTGDDGRTIHIWTSPMLAFAQIMPTWSVVEGQAVIGSNTALCKMATAQTAAQGERAKSLLDTEGFKKVAAELPRNLLSLSYVDSQAQFTQLMTQAQQLWPMAVMGAMQKGVKLPVMLPSLGQIAEDMRPSCEYCYAKPDGLYSHYQGSGVEVTLTGVAGAAVGAAVAMPAFARSREQAQRAASMSNLRQLALSVVMYADDHDGEFPDDLDQAKPYYGGTQVLQSPRKPKSFTGPSYIYVPGHSTSDPSASKSVVLYENPAFCEDTIVVAFLDGHVEAMKPDAFRQALEATYERLGRDMPEITFKD